MLALLSALGLAGLIATSDGFKDFRNRPVGSDFFAFWSAGQIINDGAPEEAYDLSRHYTEHQRLLGDEEPGFYPWLYPPTFMFAAAAFAGAPYIVAWAGWMALSLAAYYVLMRRIAPAPGAMLVALAFPAVFINIIHGQNSLMLAALLGGALFVLDRRPILAGVLIGLFSFKPHFGVLIPLALAAAGYWRTFAAAALTVISMAAASALAFGLEAWIAFFESAAASRAHLLDQEGVGWEKMQSLYAALRAVGAPSAPAYAAQAALALGLAVSLVWLWRSSAAHPVKAAGLLAASVLATPYVYDYDLLLLAPALGLLAMHGMAKGFRPYEKTALAFAYLAPLVSRGIADATLIPLGLIAGLCLYAAILKRATAETAPQSVKPDAALRPVD